MRLPQRFTCVVAVCNISNFVIYLFKSLQNFFHKRFETKKYLSQKDVFQKKNYFFNFTAPNCVNEVFPAEICE